jgi:hypothetical protein
MGNKKNRTRARFFFFDVAPLYSLNNPFAVANLRLSFFFHCVYFHARSHEETLFVPEVACLDAISHS